MQLIFVIIGLIFLTGTIAQLVTDMIYMFQSMDFKFDIFLVSLQNYWPYLAQQIDGLLTVTLADGQWAGYLDWVLAMPTFAVLGVLGLVFIVLSFLFRKSKISKSDREFT